MSIISFKALSALQAWYQQHSCDAEYVKVLYDTVLTWLKGGDVREVCIYDHMRTRETCADVHMEMSNGEQVYVFSLVSRKGLPALEDEPCWAIPDMPHLFLDRGFVKVDTSWLSEQVVLEECQRWADHWQLPVRFKWRELEAPRSSEESLWDVLVREVLTPDYARTYRVYAPMDLEDLINLLEGGGVNVLDHAEDSVRCVALARDLHKLKRLCPDLEWTYD